MNPVERSHSDGLNGALAATLRAERAARRATIAYLVDHMGVSKSTVLRLLAGDRAIDMAHLAGFAEALGMDPAELMALAEARMGATRSNVTRLYPRATVEDLRGQPHAADRSDREPPMQFLYDVAHAGNTATHTVTRTELDRARQLFPAGSLVVRRARLADKADAAHYGVTAAGGGGTGAGGAAGPGRGPGRSPSGWFAPTA